MSSEATRTFIPIVRFGAFIFALLMYVCAAPSITAADQLPTAPTPNDPLVFERYGEKMLHLGSDIADALVKTREEAIRQNVNLDEMTRYLVVFDKGKLRVHLAPPSKGGLDGPEFRVEFRRSDLKVLRVENRLH